LTAREDLELLVNDGQGNFSPVGPFLGVPNPADAATSEVDTDGDFDLIVTGEFGGVSILLNEVILATSRDCNENEMPDECDIAAAFSADCNRNRVPDECESLLSIAASDPPDGSIDARQPSDLEGMSPSGWHSIILSFTGEATQLMIDDFEVTTTTGPAPSVIAIVADGATATVEFDRPIPAGATTVIIHVPSCTSVCLGFLPGDVNSDRAVGPRDILHLVDCLNRIVACQSWQCDLNRSDLCEPADILREVDLLNGAGALDPWLDASIPACP